MSASEPESASGPKQNPVVVYLRAKGVITVPQPIREQLGLDIDDQLIVTVENRRIILTPAAVVPRDQAWFHTPEWQAKEAEADADKAAGRATHYPNNEALLASLENRTHEEAAEDPAERG